jgi:dTDP-4-amino-4,6-dideoxygalactose transaminase
MIPKTTTSSNRKISSSVPFFDYDDINKVTDQIAQILKSRRLVLGPYTREFEEQFCNYVGTRHAVAVSSATAALEIVLRYFNVKDMEVIVPTNTFIACPNTVMYAGGKPVFADMNPDTFCLDINDVQRKISSKTKAIMVVHLAGLPEPEMDSLLDLCHDRKILLMEDCSHAHGASFGEKKVGALCEAGCFSLFATKIMTSGTGGIITTDDKNLAEFAEALRHQGGMGGEGQIEVFDKFGYDWMMSEITAAIAVSQLSKLDVQIERRRAIAKSYRNELAQLKDITVPPEQSKSKSVYWKYPVYLDDGIDRDAVRTILRKQHMIDAGILYPILCHLQPVYAALGYKEGECPIAENVMKHQLTLPVNPYMTEDDVTHVVQTLGDVIATGDVKKQ